MTSLHIAPRMQKKGPRQQLLTAASGNSSDLTSRGNKKNRFNMDIICEAFFLLQVIFLFTNLQILPSKVLLANIA